MKLITCTNCGSIGIKVAKQLCTNCYWKVYKILNKERIKKRDHKYYLKNKIKFKLQQKKYWFEHIDRMHETQKIWYQKNRERLLRRAEEYRTKNLEKIKEKDKLYRQKEYVKNRDNFRKGLNRYGRGFANNAIVLQILANHQCMICKKDDKTDVFNVHHIIPFALIRNNELWNLEYLCRTCHPRREKYFRKLAQRWNIIIPSVKNLASFS